MTISEDMVLRAQATYEVAYHEHADTPAGRNAMMRAALTAALGDVVVVPREPTSEMLQAGAPFPHALVAERNDPEYTRMMECATLVERLAARTTYIRMIEAASSVTRQDGDTTTGGA